MSPEETIEQKYICYLFGAGRNQCLRTTTAKDYPVADSIQELLPGTNEVQMILY